MINFILFGSFFVMLFLNIPICQESISKILPYYSQWNIIKLM